MGRQTDTLTVTVNKPAPTPSGESVELTEQEIIDAALAECQINISETIDGQSYDVEFVFEYEIDDEE